MRYETHNLDGDGPSRCKVYDLPPFTGPDRGVGPQLEYWPAVTDVPCPEGCGGTVRWAEAGHVPGYRICDGCGRHYMASGTDAAPTLIRFGSRREKIRK